MQWILTLSEIRVDSFVVGPSTSMPIFSVSAPAPVHVSNWKAVLCKGGAVQGILAALRGPMAYLSTSGAVSVDIQLY